MSATVPTFEEAIRRLQEFWANRDALVLQPMNTEVGAGTMNPATYLRVLGPEDWRVAYVEPSVRPDDSRYGDNPNRVQTHTQFQVILKPEPGNPQEIYVESLEALGIDTERNDIRFVEDNWESPALGAWGLGWEVWLNGLEITQFTYFQQAGGMVLHPPSVEITYGLERIVMALQGVRHFKEIAYAKEVSYASLFARSELEMSRYYLDEADVDRVRAMFSLYEQEAEAMLDHSLVLPAYSYVLKLSHTFNVLDARGAVGVSERADFFARMRILSRRCSEAWVGDQLAPPLEPPAPALPVRSRSFEAAAVALDDRADLVVELGCEELPPGDLRVAIEQLGSALEHALAKADLAHEGVRVYATPRRLVAIVSQLSRSQPWRDEVIKGPRADVAWDVHGRPSKAGEGFARRSGVETEELLRVKEDDQEFAAASVRRGGVDAGLLLADMLPAAFGTLRFARAMRWNLSDVAFSRPVRWLLARHGESLVAFEFAGLQSGSSTRGLRRAAGSDELEVDDASRYRSMIRDEGIEIDGAERRAAILDAAICEAQAVGAELAPEYRDAVLDEVADMVEAPMILTGSFDEADLVLPDEVLATVMVKHQRYFPLLRGGRLASHFVIIANGLRDTQLVKAGNEAVIQARYADAKFFWESDISQGLEAMGAGLDRMTFNESLGSMAAKARRVAGLALAFSDDVELGNDEREVLRRAGELFKNDLVSEMVTEFTSLAGVMGGHYAREANESEAVANAITEHVRPTGPGKLGPASRPGALLALADRLDTLVGLFSVGVLPRSAADPHGLRRAAFGVIQILNDAFQLDLTSALERSAHAIDGNASQILPDVRDFIWRRLESVLREEGLSADVIRAALGATSERVDLRRRVAQELEHKRLDPRLVEIHRVHQRAARLASRANGEATVLESLLSEPAEIDLYRMLVQRSKQIALAEGLDNLLELMQSFVPAIDRLFDEVLVMAEDPAIANNRIALLSSVARLAERIVDLGELVFAETQPELTA